MTANTTASPLYRVDGIGKSYSGVQALAPLRLSIDQGETAASVVNSSRNHLEAQRGSSPDVAAEQGGVEVGSQGVDVVQQQVL